MASLLLSLLLSLPASDTPAHGAGDETKKVFIDLKRTYDATTINDRPFDPLREETQRLMAKMEPLRVQYLQISQKISTAIELKDLEGDDDLIKRRVFCTDNCKRLTRELQSLKARSLRRRRH